jgi:DNA repair exonuclease SbcCD nuclease subunit
VCHPTVTEGFVRLLLFSDLHLDAKFAWASARGSRRRRQAIRDCLSRICNLAADLKVDALCSAGDLYEQRRFTPDTAEFLRDSFARLPSIRVFLAPGNHDWFGPASLYEQVDWSANVHVFREPELRPAELADGFTLWGAAHCADAATPGFLEGFHTSGPGIHIALFHGSELGALPSEGEEKQPHAPFRAKEIREAGLLHALVGHFHTPRDAPEYTYPGNPEPLTFNEKGQRGAVLVTIGDDCTVDRERHIVRVADVHDVTVDLSGAEHADAVREKILRELRDLTGYARVSVEGEVGPHAEVSLDDVGDLAPAGLEVAPFRNTTTVRYDIDLWAEEETVRGHFIRDVRAAANLSDGQPGRVLTTGLRALQGRDDLEVH